MEEIEATQVAEENVEEKQFIVVILDHEMYGIKINYVDNIVRIPRITRVPKSQEYYVGVINLRGEIVPVMSLHRKFGMLDDVYQGKTRIIIVKLEDKSLVGLIVDEVKGVVTLNDTSIEIPNFKLSEDNAVYLAGIGKSEDNLIALLNIEEVVKDKVVNE